MSKLFNLSKTAKGGCDAMRCKEEEALEEVEGFLWERDSIKLCPTHVAKLMAYLEGGPEASDTKPTVIRSKRVAPVVEIDPIVANNAEQQVLAEELYKEVQALGGADDQDALDFINEILRDVKKSAKDLEAEEKSKTRPLLDALNKIRDLYRPAKKAWANLELLLKRKITNVRLAEEQRNREAQKLMADAHAAGDTVAVQEAADKVITTKGLEGTTVIPKWNFEIEDETLLPREFLMPNLTLIKEHCAHSTDREPTPIPGVRFYPDATVRTVAKKD
jgi:hypothetical protein